VAHLKILMYLTYLNISCLHPQSSTKGAVSFPADNKQRIRWVIFPGWHHW